ncbi:OLC1v1038916C3 [Oldenlandia corymbosa var. corymbosa]|uniref:OLC1v1038916C3 n=1 Tax=Oldenlandia corymbosa var. corymbosa TaxID=529605 RepID=A0AAV1D0W6_OLDCO|nr:OLC1v1038916C3 [Oldenlandia corymbosa var. corymbosa]
MKRRRKGGKKGPAKKPKTVKDNEVIDDGIPSNEGETPLVDLSDNAEGESGAEAGSPSPAAADPPESSIVPAEKQESVNPVRPIDDTAGRLVYSRVKVKLKNSKALDSQRTSSNAPTQSDADKSNQQVELEKQEATIGKNEDSDNSLPESNVGVSSNSSKKSSGIKLKSSRDPTSSSISPCNNVEINKEETKQQKDPELPSRDRQFDKQQLDASLEVIKKVMKMDAAEPFNVPVDPIALGIPDYFDVIDTPMDFGTICSNLESGAKYMNSEDVYKDVQYIWDNCFKYNNKGDYIMELMKRVKKNFMKYWTAAGLYCDHSSGNNSSDAGPGKDMPPSSDGASTPTAKKHHGLKKHKDGCLCAICVMMRRRQEREESARALGEQFETSDDYMDEDGKPQEPSSMGSPADEYTSKNMENSTGWNADGHTRSLEKLGDEKHNESVDDGKVSELAELDRRSRDENRAQNSGRNLDGGEETPTHRVSDAMTKVTDFS